MDGILTVYKERGFTSFDVVAKLRGILHMKKIGHTGTLDPQAEGVLPVCLGSATKVCELLTDRDKTYETVLRLGVVTDTQDLTGTVLRQADVTCSQEEVRACIAGFIGPGLQVPPMYSALKVDGKKLYELARQGREVERAARPVTFYEIEVLGMDLPRVRLRVRCSKGTYIRTLCHDIGERLGCGGAMESLLRTAVSPFLLQEAHRLDEIEAAMCAGTVEEWILPVDRLFEEWPAVRLDAEGSRLLRNGNALSAGRLASAFADGILPEAEKLRLYDDNGRFWAVYERRPGGEYRPLKMFPPV